uniref:Bm700 n=1 Tax=Brugia malayi TaxID=6279 RepID=A0A0H5SCE1_BRUMA|nr:Bm700 [Brugia malayi]
MIENQSEIVKGPEKPVPTSISASGDCPASTVWEDFEEISLVKKLSPVFISAELGNISGGHVGMYNALIKRISSREIMR